MPQFVSVATVCYTGKFLYVLCDAEWNCSAMMQKLRDTESDRLPVQVNAYLDNTIDVQSLLEDSDTKTAALERVSELEEALSFVSFVSSVIVSFQVVTVDLFGHPDVM